MFPAAKTVAWHENIYVFNWWLVNFDSVQKEHFSEDTYQLAEVSKQDKACEVNSLLGGLGFFWVVFAKNIE